MIIVRHIVKVYFLRQKNHQQLVTMTIVTLTIVEHTGVGHSHGLTAQWNTSQRPPLAYPMTHAHTNTHAYTHARSLPR